MGQLLTRSGIGDAMFQCKPNVDLVEYVVFSDPDRVFLWLVRWCIIGAASMTIGSMPASYVGRGYDKTSLALGVIMAGCGFGNFDFRQACPMILFASSEHQTPLAVCFIGAFDSCAYHIHSYRFAYVWFM